MSQQLHFCNGVTTESLPHQYNDAVTYKKRSVDSQKQHNHGVVELKERIF